MANTTIVCWSVKILYVCFAFFKNISLNKDPMLGRYSGIFKFISAETHWFPNAAVGTDARQSLPVTLFCELLDSAFLQLGLRKRDQFFTFN